MSPPPIAFVLFARLCPPSPPPSFARGPVKGGGVACPPSSDLMLSSSFLLSSSWALTYYVVAIATSLDASSPLSLRRRLYRHTCLIVPLLRQRLVVALSPLLPRQCLSCCAGTSLVAPPPLLWRLTCAGWLLLASPTILTCRRLSCRAGWLSLCYLSLCAAVSLFTTSLIAPPSF